MSKITKIKNYRPKDLFWFWVYLPVVPFWVGFVITWKIANYFSYDVYYMGWKFLGVIATDSQMYKAAAYRELK
jgi:hypothetical protein